MEAKFYSKQPGQKVKCNLCAHSCLLSPGQTGFCRVRTNRDGILNSWVYGRVSAGQVDPIEKKPLFHFLPGSLTYGVSTVGCNFRCQHCLNWSLSQADGRAAVSLPLIEPETIITAAKQSGCQSIAYTYNEPTINLEYYLEVMALAKKQGLKNVWVSNGYFTAEAWQALAPDLDAINVDLKAFSQQFYQKVCAAQLQPVLDNLKRIKAGKKVWLEITTLVIPTLNDSPAELKQIAEFISQELGPETPWHLSRFCPEISWQLQDLPATPAKILESAYAIGRQVGLKYVYLGNVDLPDKENTHCPACGELLVARQGFDCRVIAADGICPHCGRKADLIINPNDQIPMTN